MSKKPDISDLSKKFDLGGIVDNIKSLVNPSGDIPSADVNDALGIKIAGITLEMKDLIAEQEAMTKSLLAISRNLNATFNDLQAIRAELAELKGETIDKDAELDAESSKASKSSDATDNDQGSDKMGE